MVFPPILFLQLPLAAKQLEANPSTEHDMPIFAKALPLIPELLTASFNYRPHHSSADPKQ